MCDISVSKDRQRETTFCLTPSSIYLHSYLCSMSVKFPRVYVCKYVCLLNCNVCSLDCT